MSDSTDWIREGATVAEVVPSNNAGASGVYPTAIDRIHGGYIHLANGNRYHRKTMLPGKRNTGTGGAPTVKLLPITDPEVRRSRALKDLDYVATTASRAHRRGATNVDDVLEALAEIEQAVRDARAAITSKEA